MTVKNTDTVGVPLLTIVFLGAVVPSTTLFPEATGAGAAVVFVSGKGRSCSLVGSGGGRPSGWRNVWVMMTWVGWEEGIFASGGGAGVDVVVVVVVGPFWVVEVLGFG